MTPRTTDAPPSPTDGSGSTPPGAGLQRDDLRHPPRRGSSAVRPQIGPAARPQTAALVARPLALRRARSRAPSGRSPCTPLRARPSQAARSPGAARSSSPPTPTCSTTCSGWPRPPAPRWRSRPTPGRRGAPGRPRRSSSSGRTRPSGCARLRLPRREGVVLLGARPRRRRHLAAGGRGGRRARRVPARRASSGWSSGSPTPPRRAGRRRRSSRSSAVAAARAPRRWPARSRSPRPGPARRTLLVDGDPLGGGIDLVFGGEEDRGAALARPRRHPRPAWPPAR